MRLKLVVDMMAKPRALATMDLVPPTGFLFAGAPGTGKTFLARAFAGEPKMPFFQLSAGELESKRALTIIKEKIDLIVVDTAHGHTKKVKEIWY